MTGPIALVGSGEFTPAAESIDRQLLAATGRRRPRVAILPTAAFADGEDAFRRCAELGRAHFTALGAEVEPVLVRTRSDAEDPGHVQAVGEADVVYLGGGSAPLLYRTLQSTALERALRAAHARGSVLAGCSAGAVVLCEHQLVIRRRLPFPAQWRPALGIAGGLAFAPAYDRRPEALTLLLILRAPRGTVVVGIDQETALVGRDASWQVHGPGRVTVWRGRRRTRHRDGEVIRIGVWAGRDLPAG